MIDIIDLTKEQDNNKYIVIRFISNNKKLMLCYNNFDYFKYKSPEHPEIAFLEYNKIKKSDFDVYLEIK